MFTIHIEPEAKEDIQSGIDWYNKQQAGLGKSFHKHVKTQIDKLKKQPFYQVRYDNVHCLPLHKFPYLIHYTINETERLITIRAVFNTSRDPKIWLKRK